MALKHDKFWHTDNVTKFKGYDVTNGEVDLSESEYEDILDEIYEPVVICGMTYNVGAILSGVDPVAFRCAQGDHESELTSELEDQLENEDDSDIEFEEELDEDEDDDQ
jgi:hypothetical protein